MRKLASVQKIEAVEPIENADYIEKVKVLGWTLVAKKGEFVPGDLCVYFEIDSLLPDVPEFEFINKATVYTLQCGNCPATTPVPKNDAVFKKDIVHLCPNCGSNDTRVVEGYELRKEKSRKLTTKKMRGVVSQGLAMPIDAIRRVFVQLGKNEEAERAFTVGDDLTEALQVTKFEPPVDMRRAANTKCTFPRYVPKTDETRLQSIPDILKEIAGKHCYVTVKLDGTSATYIHKDGEFHVCSRRLSLKDPDEDKNLPLDWYWAMAKKYDILAKLAARGNFAVQGEICGPGIQKNRLGLKNIELFLFDVYDIDKQQYCGFQTLCDFAETFGIPMVPILDDIFLPGDAATVEDFLAMAEGKYEGTKNEREGIVVRPVRTEFGEVLQGRMSFKVVSNRFLLKGGE